MAESSIGRRLHRSRPQRQGLRQETRRRHHPSRRQRRQNRRHQHPRQIRRRIRQNRQNRTRTIAPSREASPHSPPKAASNAPSTSKTRKPNLKGLGHDSKSIAEIMNNALASVKGTAFGLGDAATVAATLSAAGIKSGDQMTNVLKTVADTAQISGRSLTDIGTIFSSVAARGKLQGDDHAPTHELRRTRPPTARQTPRQNLGRGLRHGVQRPDRLPNIRRLHAGRIGGAALAAGDTFQGALANVKAALGRLGEGPGKLALESLRKAFNAAIPAIDALSGQLTPFLDKPQRPARPLHRQGDRPDRTVRERTAGRQHHHPGHRRTSRPTRRRARRIRRRRRQRRPRSPACSTRSANSATADSTNSPRA